jgi:DNA gyrase subunit A
MSEIPGIEFERPKLNHIDPEVVKYIEALEAKIEQLLDQKRDLTEKIIPEPAIESFEPPTTINIITISTAGFAKRTPRHLYSRQRRGGMGVFDIEASENDPPTIITSADESQTILLFTNLARVFRMPITNLVASPVHSRGQAIVSKFGLMSEERLVAAVPFHAKGAIALLGRSGMVRHLRYHIFGEHLKPGTVLFNLNQFGPLMSACPTTGEDDLFLATRKGRAIRFSEKLVLPQGCQGIRLEPDDEAIAITAVQPDDGVFLSDVYGRGSIRLMSGFAPNKSTGGSGKIAMNTDELVGAVTIQGTVDIFMISRLSKIIRFSASEIPAKENPVQGVNCMALRADEVVSTIIS